MTADLSPDAPAADLLARAGHQSTHNAVGSVLAIADTDVHAAAVGALAAILRLDDTDTADALACWARHNDQPTQRTACLLAAQLIRLIEQVSA